MLKDEFCTLEGSRCVILRGRGRCATLVSTAALQPSFNGSLRLPSFNGSLRLPSFRVSTQPAAASSIVEVKVTTQVKVVKVLYTEVRNVQHLACVSRVFALIDRESDG